MHLTTASACVVLASGLCILGGCRQEEPQKAHITKAAPAPQATPTQQTRLNTGEALFKQYCAPCHPDGGNVTDKQRTLRGSALKKHNITSPEAIVNIMRHPISRMIRFDETTIPDKDALAIAEYVLNRFR